MTVPEVTREQAKSIAAMHRTEVGTETSTAMARTILWLYDRVEEATVVIREHAEAMRDLVEHQEFRCSVHDSPLGRRDTEPGKWDWVCAAGHVHGGGMDGGTLDLGLVREEATDWIRDSGGFVIENVAISVQQYDAMRACIDRLRDGWRIEGIEWVWIDSYQVTTRREPMTPEEQAVMGGGS